MKKNQENGEKEKPERESSKKQKEKQKAKQTEQHSRGAAKKQPERPEGLTLKEWLRLRYLRYQLSKDQEKKQKPTTAQRTISFEHMYKDGICRVTPTYYTKMIEFQDMNYSLLEEEDKSDIRELYKGFLDFFEPGIRFQLFMFNRKVSQESIERQFDFSGGEDHFADLRAEQQALVQMNAKNGTNGIRKSRYVIFGMNCQNIQEARVRLGNTEKDVIKNLENIGTWARTLNGRERLEVLYEYFHQDTLDDFHFSWKSMEESGNTVMDYIAPASFDLRKKDYLKCGDMYGSMKYVQILAPKFKDDMLKNILDINGNLTVSMHVQTIDILKARKMIKAALSDTQGSKIKEQRKAFEKGYDSDILPPELIANEAGLKQMLEDTNTSNQKLIFITFLIGVFGRTKKELENLTRTIAGTMQIAECPLRPLDFLQEQGLMACAPIGCNNTGIRRSLDTRCMAVMVPFCTQELLMKGEPIFMGTNKLSHNLIMIDRKQLRNPNGVILGTPGSGKSFIAKHEILCTRILTKDDILICDPEGEYYPIVEALEGQVIRLTPESGHFINPMDIVITRSGLREALRMKADFLITLVDLIAGETRKLEADERGIVDECISQIYHTFLQDPVPEKMPLMEDLYKALLAHPNPKAERIANCLYLYVHGSQNYFNHRTNVDFQNRLVCFDIKDLSDNLHDLGMLIVQDAVWNRVAMNRERRIATRYFCDEFHLLLREPRTAGYMVEMWKRFRKWYGIPTAITQNVADFLRSQDIESILGNSDYVCLLNQSAKDQDILIDKLDLSKKQLEYVTNAEQGSGLIIFDDVMIPFLNKYDTDSRCYKIMSTKPEEAIQRKKEEAYDPFDTVERIAEVEEGNNDQNGQSN